MPTEDQIYHKRPELEKGIYFANKNEEYFVDALKLKDEVIDTTGAGDAFNGGFAAALSEGQTPLKAVTFGCATAGISVTRAGTAPSMPSRSEVEKVLATQL